MRSIVPILVLLIATELALGQGPPLRDRNLGGPAAPGGQARMDPRYLPPQPPPAGRWRLGLRVQYRDIGALVTQIVPNSAAGRAGLEPGDLILNVDGYQIGYVQGTLFDLAEECYRRCSDTGQVNLLVRNGRNGQLVNVPLQLDRGNTGQLLGSLTTDMPNFVSNSAVAVIRLVEQPRWGGRPTTLVEERVRCGRFPMRFELNYNPNELGGQDRQYGLEADIVDQGQLLFRTRGLADFRQGQPVSLMAYRVGGPPPRPDPWWPGNPIADVLTWYRRYFDRDPSPAALQHYQALVQRGYGIRDIRIQMLSGTDFFELCGSDPERFLFRVYEKTQGRRPNPQELRAWQRRFDELRGNRPAFVRQLFEAGVN